MQFRFSKRPLEFFGQDTYFSPKINPANWNQSNSQSALTCPYHKGKQCIKITKTPPVEVIGCCVAGLPKPGIRGQYESIITCPKRFYEDNIIFNDIANMLLKKEIQSSKFKKIKLYSELGTPSPHDRQIDFVIGAFDKNDSVMNYVAIEIQATATGSTGPIVPARNDYFGKSGESFKDTYNYGTNITMSSKTILEQILHKTPLFQAWGKKLVLVIQDSFLRHLRRQYNFGIFSPLVLNHDLMIFSYRLNKIKYGYQLELDEVISAPNDLVPLCILPNKTIMQEMVGAEVEFTNKFASHISRDI
jgi:hypothetical protein